MELSADVTMILAYWKLQDDVVDAGFWGGLLSRFLSMVYRRAYRKAAERRPNFDRAVVDCLARLRRLEVEKSPSIDRTADTFALILAAAGDETGDRVLRQLLYHVGRWIYLIDARDDLEQDARQGSYNPILYRFSGEEERQEETIRLSLRHSLGLAASAFELGEFGRWRGVLENMIYLGLPQVEEAVFSGQWRKQRKEISGRQMKDDRSI